MRAPWFIGFLCMLLVAGCSLTRPPTEYPELRVAAIEAERLGLNQQVFRVRLQLYNPNEVRIRVASGALTLDLEDIRVGNDRGQLLAQGTLPTGITVYDQAGFL